MVPTDAAPDDAVHVLLVDDEPLFRKSLGDNLVDAGFSVTEFSDGRYLLDFFAEGGVADLVLLDWRMPDLDGRETLQRLRRDGIEVPVIFLTVLSDQVYEEAALADGAVDYVEKSRSFTILERRVRLIVQGSKGASTGVGDPQDSVPDPLVIGPLELRTQNRRAFWREDRVDLTLTEFNITRLLAANAGEDVSYRDIYDLVHGKGFAAGYGAEGYRANVRSFIKRIRHKFRMLDDDFDRVENYPGFGYRWIERG